MATQESPFCLSCHWQFTDDEMSVKAFSADGKGGVKRVVLPTGFLAQRCMSCENIQQHPDTSTREYVARDGYRVSPMFSDANDGFKWLLSHQGMSVDYALRYGGYSFHTSD